MEQRPVKQRRYDPSPNHQHHLNKSDDDSGTAVAAVATAATAATATTAAAAAPPTATTTTSSAPPIQSQQWQPHRVPPVVGPSFDTAVLFYEPDRRPNDYHRQHHSNNKIVHHHNHIDQGRRCSSTSNNGGLTEEDFCQLLKEESTSFSSYSDGCGVDNKSHGNYSDRRRRQDGCCMNDSNQSFLQWLWNYFTSPTVYHLTTGTVRMLHGWLLLQLGSSCSSASISSSSSFATTTTTTTNTISTKEQLWYLQACLYRLYQTFPIAIILPTTELVQETMNLYMQQIIRMVELQRYHHHRGWIDLEDWWWNNETKQQQKEMETRKGQKEEVVHGEKEESHHPNNPHHSTSSYSSSNRLCLCLETIHVMIDSWVVALAKEVSEEQQQHHHHQQQYCWTDSAERRRQVGHGRHGNTYELYLDHYQDFLLALLVILRRTNGSGVKQPPHEQEDNHNQPPPPPHDASTTTTTTTMTNSILFTTASKVLRTLTMATTTMTPTNATPTNATAQAAASTAVPNLGPCSALPTSQFPHGYSPPHRWAQIAQRVMEEQEQYHHDHNCTTTNSNNHYVKNVKNAKNNNNNNSFGSMSHGTPNSACRGDATNSVRSSSQGGRQPPQCHTLSEWLFHKECLVQYFSFGNFHPTPPLPPPSSYADDTVLLIDEKDIEQLAGLILWEDDMEKEEDSQGPGRRGGFGGGRVPARTASAVDVGRLQFRATRCLTQIVVVATTATTTTTTTTTRHVSFPSPVIVLRRLLHIFITASNPYVQRQIVPSLLRMWHWRWWWSSSSSSSPRYERSSSRRAADPEGNDDNTANHNYNQLTRLVEVLVDLLLVTTSNTNTTVSSSFEVEWEHGLNLSGGSGDDGGCGIPSWWDNATSLLQIVLLSSSSSSSPPIRIFCQDDVLTLCCSLLDHSYPLRIHKCAIDTLSEYFSFDSSTNDNGNQPTIPLSHGYALLRSLITPLLQSNDWLEENDCDYSNNPFLGGGGRRRQTMRTTTTTTSTTTFTTKAKAMDLLVWLTNHQQQQQQPSSWYLSQLIRIPRALECFIRCATTTSRNIEDGTEDIRTVVIQNRQRRRIASQALALLLAMAQDPLHHRIMAQEPGLLALFIRSLRVDDDDDGMLMNSDHHNDEESSSPSGPSVGNTATLRYESQEGHEREWIAKKPNRDVIKGAILRIAAAM